MVPIPGGCARILPYAAFQVKSLSSYPQIYHLLHVSLPKAAGFQWLLITRKVLDARRQGATTEAYGPIRRKEERSKATPQMMPLWLIRNYFLDTFLLFDRYLTFYFTAEAQSSQRVMIFPFAADPPSLKLWRGRVAGKGKPLSPAKGGTV